MGVVYVEEKKITYFEDLEPLIQEVIIDLIVSIIENRKNPKLED